MEDVESTLRKNRARSAFQEAFNNHDNPDKIWELLIVYRRLLGENEHF